jgi:hypothetical protein
MRNKGTAGVRRNCLSAHSNIFSVLLRSLFSLTCKHFKIFKGDNMFRPIWPSSGVKINTKYIFNTLTFKVNKCLHVRLKSGRKKWKSVTGCYNTILFFHSLCFTLNCACSILLTFTDNNKDIKKPISNNKIMSD